MKTTIEFGDDEREDALLAMRAWEWQALVAAFDEECRRLIKYTEGESNAHAEWARERLHHLMQERSLELT